MHEGTGMGLEAGPGDAVAEGIEMAAARQDAGFRVLEPEAPLLLELACARSRSRRTILR